MGFTQRFAKNKNRHPHRNRTRLKPKGSSNSNTQDAETKDTEPDTVSFSPFDPMNPSYTTHDADDEEDYDSEPEEGFSVDQYYVPFRVNKARTKRKPDAPFMAMFSMYASNRNNKTTENGHHHDEEYRNGHSDQQTVHSPILD